MYGFPAFSETFERKSQTGENKLNFKGHLQRILKGL